MSSAGQSQGAGSVVLLMSNINERYFSLKGQSACPCMGACVWGVGGWFSWVCICVCVDAFSQVSWVFKRPKCCKDGNDSRCLANTHAHPPPHEYEHTYTHVCIYPQEADVRTPWKFNTNAKESKEFVIKLTICWAHPRPPCRRLCFYAALN